MVKIYTVYILFLSDNYFDYMQKLITSLFSPSSFQAQ